MTAKIVVVGSLNMDLVFRASRLPLSGETLAGRSFATLPGGKGGNQAVAAARLGAQVAMIACVGDDVYGAPLREGLEQEGIDCAAVGLQAGMMTGVALVLVDDRGQNAIVIVAGANDALTPQAVEGHAALIDAAEFVICQLEIPPQTVEWTIERARKGFAKVILNPAPAIGPLPRRWLKAVDYLIPNEIEAAALSGVLVDEPDSARAAAEILREAGASTVIVTLGAQGVFALTAEAGRHYPASPVIAVDTTAAGDTFVGGFAAALAAGRRFSDAIVYGQAAAAISVTRHGARPSIPHSREIE